MRNLRYLSPAHDVLAFETEDGGAVVKDKGRPGWDEPEAMGPAPSEPPEPDPPATPQVVSRFQARAALMDAGLLADVELAVGRAGPLIQLAWAEAVEWRRDSPTITAIGAALGLSPEALDDLFRAAAQITA